MAGGNSITWIGGAASFEASLREARDSKDQRAHLQKAWAEPFAMPPPNERPVFELPLPESRWRWRER